MRAKAGNIGLDQLRQRRDALVREMEQVVAHADAAAFADAKQRDLLARLENANQTLKAAGSEPEMNVARERARRVGGALSWQLTQDYPARLWDAQKGLKILDAELAEAHRRDAALAQAQRDEPARHDAFGARIGGLDQRLRALIPRVAALSSEQQGQVQELAVAELTRQKERLALYATQARFAVAQLYDRAAMASQSDHATKQ